jgi:hypothetical protein
MVVCGGFEEYVGIYRGLCIASGADKLEDL